MASSAPKLSTALQFVKGSVSSSLDNKVKVLHLYRRVQKSVPALLKVYAIDEPVAEVRATLKRQFQKYGSEKIDTKVANMLIFKGQSELEEAEAQWKTRTHILRYVYDKTYKPHLARSKTPLPGLDREVDPFSLARE